MYNSLVILALMKEKGNVDILLTMLTKSEYSLFEGRAWLIGETLYFLFFPKIEKLYLVPGKNGNEIRYKCTLRIDGYILS